MKPKRNGNPEDQKTIGARVRWARVEAEMSQTRLAQLLGIRQSAVSMIETDETRTTSHLPEIGHFTGVDPYWLHNGGPEPRAAGTPPPATRADAEALSEFGLRVQRIRERLGFSEATAARGIMERGDWIAVEKGRLLPGPVALDLLSSRLNTSLDWLVRGMRKDQIPSVAPDPDLVRRLHDSSRPLITD